MHVNRFSCWKDRLLICQYWKYTELFASLIQANKRIHIISTFHLFNGKWQMKLVGSRLVSSYWPCKLANWVQYFWESVFCCWYYWISKPLEVLEKGWSFVLTDHMKVRFDNCTAYIMKNSCHFTNIKFSLFWWNIDTIMTLLIYVY